MEKNILITGANSSFGKSIARKFGETDNVIIISKNEEDSRKVLETVTNAKCYSCDVLDVQSLNKVIDKIVAEQGKIDIFINDVGGWLDDESISELFDFSNEKLKFIIGSNVCINDAVFFNMIANKGGLICNTCSRVYYTENPLSLYHIARQELEGYYRNYSADIESNGIILKGIYFSPEDSNGLSQNEIFDLETEYLCSRVINLSDSIKK